MDSNDPDQNQNEQDYKKSIVDSYQEYEDLLERCDKEQKAIIGSAYQDINQKLIQKMREQIEATLKSFSESGNLDSFDTNQGEGNVGTGGRKARELLGNISRNNSHFARIAEKYAELFPENELNEGSDWHILIDSYREQILRAFDTVGEVLSSLNQNSTESESELLELYRYLEEQRLAVDHLFGEKDSLVSHKMVEKTGMDAEIAVVPNTYQVEEAKPTLYDSLDSRIEEKKIDLPHENVADATPPGQSSEKTLLAPDKEPRPFNVEQKIEPQSEYVPRENIVFDYSDENNLKPENLEILEEPRKEEAVLAPNTEVYEQPIQTKIQKEEVAKEDALEKTLLEKKEEKEESSDEKVEDSSDHQDKSHHKTTKEDEKEEKTDKKSKKNQEEEKEGVKELKLKIDGVDEEIKKTEDSIRELKQIEEEEKSTIGSDDAMDIEGRALLQAEISRMEAKAEELKKQKEELEKELDKFK